MRLKNMYFTCKQNIDTIEGITFQDKKLPDGGTNRTIVNFNEVKQALDNLYNIECLKETIDSFISLCTDFNRQDRYFIFHDDYAKFCKIKNTLEERIQTIIDLGDSVGFEEFEYGFDIKMPPNQSLSDMSKCIGDINKLLEQCPYLHEDGESLEFKCVDVGSFWLDFLAVCSGATILLTNLAKVVDKAVAVASHIASVRMQYEQMKTLNLQNEILETTVATNKTVCNALLERCCRELNEEIHPLEPEENARLKLSLELMSEWMSKGMEVYASIESPKDIQVLFPNKEQQKFLTEARKMLPKSESDPEDS